MPKSLRVSEEIMKTIAGAWPRISTKTKLKYVERDKYRIRTGVGKQYVQVYVFRRSGQRTGFAYSWKLDTLYMWEPKENVIKLGE